ncbi:MAG: ribosomal protein S18-alanine N-acetyltransferase [Acidobacteriota bacterium]
MSQTTAVLLPGFGVRPMWDDDVAEVVNLERQSFSMAWTPSGFRHEIHENPYARCLVVRHADGVLAGYASIWILDRQMLVNNVAIAPAFRRRGLGRALMEHLIRTAREADCLAALLEVRPTNRPALAMYRRLGFRKAAVRRHYYTDGEDALVLRLELRRGPAGA